MKAFISHLIPLACCICLLASGCGVVQDFTTEVYYSLDNPVPASIEETMDTLCTIKYSVDNKNQQAVIFDQRNLDFFLYTMLDEAERGAKISAVAHPTGQGVDQNAFSDSKKPITYTTPDNNQAKEWVKKMLLKGYKVSIVFDRKKKIYTCTAYSSKKS